MPQESGVLSLVGRVLIIATVLGAILLALFKWLYPQVEVSEVLSLIALISLLAAVALNVAWTCWKKREEGVKCN